MKDEQRKLGLEDIISKLSLGEVKIRTSENEIMDIWFEQIKEEN